jgi:bisphosphoglycerate-dependent phosphoglycerate mutase
MEIIKRKSGIRYREMYWLNGQPIKSPIFRRKTDCVQWLAKQRSQKVENELYGDLQKLRQIKTIEEFGQEWCPIALKVYQGNRMKVYRPYPLN